LKFAIVSVAGERIIDWVLFCHKRDSATQARSVGSPKDHRVKYIPRIAQYSQDRFQQIADTDQMKEPSGCISGACLGRNFTLGKSIRM
jgi:hypothetical protein